MTFIEAAADILEREGKPLHAKDIAEKAISLGLLSHVGKTPVQTMSAQLSAAVLKGKSLFSRVRPGVFSLAKWQGKPPGRSKSPRPLAEENAAFPVEEAPIEPSPVELDEEEMDQRISGSASEEPAGADTASSKRRKRRRKKASRASAPPANVGSEIAIAAVPPDDIRKVEPIRPHSHLVVQAEEFHLPAVKEKPLSALVPTDKSNDEISDLVEKVLRRASRPLPVEKIQEEIGMAAQNNSILLEALLVSDAFEREKTGRMPRFVRHKSGYALLEREVSAEIVALESQAAEIKRRLAQLAEKQLLKKLRGLSIPGFVRTMMIFLERLGFGAAKPAPLKFSQGFHLSVQDRRRGGKFRTAVVLRRDPVDYVLSEREVMDLRGAMHHFDAMGGMIFTTGQVGDKARAEGRIANLPPVEAVDGETLSREMVSLGIGVKERAVHLPVYDDGFFMKIES
jgi:hypothetical protein